LAEIRNRLDVVQVACAMIPDAFGEAAEWHRYAQIFIADVLRRAYAENATNSRIVQMATVTELSRLRKLLANSPAAALGAEHNERMFGSVRGVVTAHMAPLMLCHADAGRDVFSIRRWVEEGCGWAYINYKDSHLPHLRFLIGAMLDVASTAVLDLPAPSEDRVWLVLDEVAALGRIQSLAAFLTRARKHGGCTMLGVQSNAQLRETYGPDGAQVILSSCSNVLMLAVNDPDTAEHASRTLGEAEYARKIMSGGKSDDGAHQGWSYEYRVSPIVLPSEVSAQPLLHGYLKLTGCHEAAQITLRIPEAQSGGCEPFVFRELPEITLEEFAPPPPDGGSEAPAPRDDLPDFSGSGREEAP
jgi:type IV secretory pathway TraG/TraD family ATPase VirD4